MTAYTTLDDVRVALRGDKPVNREWAAKMLHEVPDLPTIPDRAKYLVEKAKGRVVLDIGCTGAISEGILAVAKAYYGLDKEPGPQWGFCNLDEYPEGMPVAPDVDLIIASELIEHLANPGRFLAALRAAYPDREVIITVPQAGAYQVRHGTHEVVHRDHVAWYSYTTLATLLRRYGYRIEVARWYNGQPHKAEGLVVLVR